MSPESLIEIQKGLVYLKPENAEAHDKRLDVSDCTLDVTPRKFDWGLATEKAQDDAYPLLM